MFYITYSHIVKPELQLLQKKAKTGQNQTFYGISQYIIKYAIFCAFHRDWSKIYFFSNKFLIYPSFGHWAATQTI